MHQICLVKTYLCMNLSNRLFFVNMRTFFSILLFVALMGTMVSCFTYHAFRHPVSTEQPTNNQTYEIDYLFELDGCKVYRFYDKGNYVYFTNCQGNVTSIKNDSTAKRITNSVRVTYDDYNEIQKDK